MAATKPSPRFQVGDRVKIRYSDWRARVVEFRGALGVGGAFIYRVRVPLKPKPTYIELREDQLIAIPTPPKAKPSPDGTTQPKETTAALPLFRKGDRVEIRDTNWKGRVIELRLPPRGVYVYRVRVPAEPRSIYLDIPENYLVAIPPPPKRKPKPSTQRRVRDERKEK
jgi:hypothetical protein